jgi:hypothetical protein
VIYLELPTIFHCTLYPIVIQMFPKGSIANRTIGLVQNDTDYQGFTKFKFFTDAPTAHPRVGKLMITVFRFLRTKLARGMCLSYRQPIRLVQYDQSSQRSRCGTVQTGIAQVQSSPNFTLGSDQCTSFGYWCGTSLD